MSNSINRVLVLGYVWPEPNSSAAGKHMLSFLATFQQQGWEITFASPAEYSEHAVDLPAMGIVQQRVALNCSSFDEFIQHLKPDLVMFDRFMLEEQFGWRVAKYCPDAIRVLDTEDLHCLRWARHQAHKAQRPLQAQDWQSDIAKREIAAIFRCDLSLIISDFEYQLLQQQFQVPAFLLLHLPFMLEPEQQQVSLPFTARQHFISIGNFRHAPNWDAVLWLHQQLWPLIRKQLPDAELHLYGAYPPPKATQLHNPKQGFMVKGWAEDAMQVMGQARVCLAPLRFGAGIKGKLADAMLCHTPSITTDIGAEGMCGDQPWPGFIANEATDFADKAVALYKQQAIWEQASQQGEHILSQRFNKALLQQRLLARIEQIQLNLQAHRMENFIGAMLQHHQLKSTQYMAQWIEAKNR